MDSIAAIKLNFRPTVGAENVKGVRFCRDLQHPETGEHQMQAPSNNDSTVQIHLLDSAQGHPLQTWQFDDQDRVTIGRAQENDIALSDQRVSRLHAELFYSEDGWKLVSRGRNGTQINGLLVAEYELCDETVFQLGPSGPSLCFSTVREVADFSATFVNPHSDGLEHLVIDQEQTADEVNQIIESAAFQELQKQARQLKSRTSE